MGKQFWLPSSGRFPTNGSGVAAYSNSVPLNATVLQYGATSPTMGRNGSGLLWLPWSLFHRFPTQLFWLLQKVLLLPRLLRSLPHRKLKTALGHLLGPQTRCRTYPLLAVDCRIFLGFQLCLTPLCHRLLWPQWLRLSRMPPNRYAPWWIIVPPPTPTQFLPNLSLRRQQEHWANWWQEPG